MSYDCQREDSTCKHKNILFRMQNYTAFSKLCHNSAKFCMTSVKCSTQCCTYQEKIWERKNSGLCAMSLQICCAQQLTHTNQNFSSLKFSLDCAAVYTAQNVESCKILQSYDTISKMQLYFTFSIKYFCVCKWNVPSDSHMTWGCNNFCSSIIPSTHTMNATQRGHFWVIREGSYDYETHGNRFYGSNIV